MTKTPLWPSGKKIRKSELDPRAAGSGASGRRWRARPLTSCPSQHSNRRTRRTRSIKDPLLTFKKVPPHRLGREASTGQTCSFSELSLALYWHSSSVFRSPFYRSAARWALCRKKGDKEQYETQIDIQTKGDLSGVKLVITFPSKCRFDVAVSLGTLSSLHSQRRRDIFLFSFYFTRPPSRCNLGLFKRTSAIDFIWFSGANCSAGPGKQRQTFV